MKRLQHKHVYLEITSIITVPPREGAGELDTHHTMGTIHHIHSQIPSTNKA